MKKTEVIIHYSPGHTDEDLVSTLNSMNEQDIIPQAIRLCINPPREKMLYKSFIDTIHEIFNTKVECYLQILTHTNERVEDVINKTAELSNADYYIFVNCGYRFKDNKVLSEIRNNPVIFYDPADEFYNEFACSVKLHKSLGGFGKYSLIEKIEYKIKMLEEAKAKVDAESGN